MGKGCQRIGNFRGQCSPFLIRFSKRSSPISEIPSCGRFLGTSSCINGFRETVAGAGWSVAGDCVGAIEKA